MVEKIYWMEKGNRQVLKGDQAMIYCLDTSGLEDWAPSHPAERWCRVEILERYEFDGRPRLRVKILEGPEKGRIVSGLSPGNLRSGRECER